MTTQKAHWLIWSVIQQALGKHCSASGMTREGLGIKWGKVPRQLYNFNLLKYEPGLS